MKMKTILIAGAVMITFVQPAYADERDERIKMLEQQVQFLAAEIQNLKQEQSEDRMIVESINQDVQDAKTSLAIIEPAVGVPNAQSDDDVKITLGTTPKIQKGKFSWQPTGRLHIDAAAFNDDKVDHPNGAEVRRARLGMKGQVNDDFGYKLEIDFANEGVSFRDAYVSYTGLETTELRVGNIKPPLGLEELTSSNNITLIERSAPTAAFVRGHILGADITTHGENWSLTGGVFNDDVGVQSSDDEAWSVGVRGTLTPLQNDNGLVHLGASAAYRSPNQANDRFDFDSRAENALQSIDSVSANFTNADNAQLYGFEFAAAHGPFSAQGEYFMVDVDRNTSSNLDFGGGYGQVSWVLTGESRGYSSDSGTFGGVKPARLFDPKNGDWGAFELAARYSHLDVSDADIQGGEMDNVTLGANWYLNNNMRLMANYIFVDTDENAVTADDDPQIILVRSQVNF